jgi:hypothetical protein
LRSLVQIKLENVLNQYFLEDLALCEPPSEASAKASYLAVRQSVTIAKKFVQFSSIPSFDDTIPEVEKIEWRVKMANVAARTETAIVSFINKYRKLSADRKRDRKIGSTVTAINKAWSDISDSVKDNIPPPEIFFRR